MAIKLTTTKEAGDFAKVLVYGRAGVGKTRLIKTAPSPIIISTESGLLSLRKWKIPVIEVETFADMLEAYEIATSKKCKEYKTIAIDSLSDIAESILVELKGKNKDPRKAYGELADLVTTIIRKFRDIKNKHVYVTTKQKRVEAEEGGELYFPSMPGTNLLQNIPYFFDEVLSLQIVKDKNDKQKRILQCQPDYQYDAKDRSGNLEMYEKPDLSYIFNKIIAE